MTQQRITPPRLDGEQILQIRAERLAAMLSELPEKQKAYVLGAVPESQKNIFALAFSGGSKAKALQAKCLQCSNFDRAEVTACTVTTCPVHAVRPYQRGAEESENE